MVNQRARTPMEAMVRARVRGVGADVCWPWAGTVRGNGYGRLRVGGRGGRDLLAHRAVYEVLVGPIPDGLCVCHSCDNPPCVNPAHLFLGTQFDNMRDMAAKGRQSRQQRPDLILRGESVKGSKLTWEKVSAIRMRYAAGGVTQQDLAAEYGVRQSLISRIVLGQSWTLPW